MADGRKTIQKNNKVMCLFPKLMPNKKYQKNKKNGGIIPPLPIINGEEDKRVLFVPIACGNCMECRKAKAREWQVRLSEEVKHQKLKPIMVTLTFSDESILELGNITKKKGYEQDNAIATLGVRRFLERWRKKYKKSLRHWFITELGHNGTENVHMHGIVWTDKDPSEIRSIWKYGFVWLSTEDPSGFVNYRTVNYLVKYVHKSDEKHKYYKPKVLTSRGIGKGYTKTHNFKQNKFKSNGKTKDNYVNPQGYKFALPIYYRNKRYNEEEREILWIEKLDKQIRYVNGIKIDVSENDINYLHALKFAREKNKRLGYMEDTWSADQWKYEN